MKVDLINRFVLEASFDDVRVDLAQIVSLIEDRFQVSVEADGSLRGETDTSGRLLSLRLPPGFGTGPDNRLRFSAHFAFKTEDRSLRSGEGSFWFAQEVLRGVLLRAPVPVEEVGLPALRRTVEAAKEEIQARRLTVEWADGERNGAEWEEPYVEILAGLRQACEAK